MTPYEFVKKCQRYRRAEGFSQGDVAKDLGMSQSNISKFERGENDSIAIAMWYINKGMIIFGGID